MPGAPSSGTPREIQAKIGDGTGGDCKRFLWVPGPRVSIRGKFVLSRNQGYTTRGVAMRLIVVLTPG